MVLYTVRNVCQPAHVQNVALHAIRSSDALPPPGAREALFEALFIWTAEGKVGGKKGNKEGECVSWKLPAKDVQKPFCLHPFQGEDRRGGGGGIFASSPEIYSLCSSSSSRSWRENQKRWPCVSILYKPFLFKIIGIYYIFRVRLFLVLDKWRLIGDKFQLFTHTGLLYCAAPSFHTSSGCIHVVWIRIHFFFKYMIRSSGSPGKLATLGHE